VSGSGPGRLGPWWREPGRVAGVAAGLLLVERLLVGEVGSPTALARTLQGLGDPGADPILSTLALMALLAEAFVGYLLLVLALRSLATLPGSTAAWLDGPRLRWPRPWSGAWSTSSLAPRCLFRSPWQPRTRRSVIGQAVPARRWSPRRRAADPAGQ